MASRLFISVVAVLHLLLLAVSATPVAKSSISSNNMILHSLNRKGYRAMALTLDKTLKTLLMNNKDQQTSKYTIFCPSDKSFYFKDHIPQPSMQLLQYHVVPVKLRRQDLSSMSGAKIETLLWGHSLVVTSSEGKDDQQMTTINDVEVKEWGIYEDEGVIVHGVDRFFDPASQTLLLPGHDWWFNSDAVTRRQH